MLSWNIFHMAELVRIRICKINKYILCLSCSFSSSLKYFARKSFRIWFFWCLMCTVFLGVHNVHNASDMKNKSAWSQDLLLALPILSYWYKSVFTNFWHTRSILTVEESILGSGLYINHKYYSTSSCLKVAMLMMFAGSIWEYLETDKAAINLKKEG